MYLPQGQRRYLLDGSTPAMASSDGEIAQEFRPLLEGPQGRPHPAPHAPRREDPDTATGVRSFVAYLMST